MDDLISLFQTVWKNFEKVINFQFYHIDMGKYLIALCIFIAFILFRRLFTIIILARIESWLAKTNPYFQEKVLKELEDPIRFIPVVLGISFAFEYLNIVDIHPWNPILHSLIIFNLFWGLFNITHPISSLISKSNLTLSGPLVSWVSRALRVAIVIIGAAVILDQWGIKIGPILAGLGLLGMAVALGAQDMFKNIIAGVSIIAEKRFNIGDIIKVEGVVEGIVENIGFRSTLVRRFDKAPVYVPNTNLSDAAVTNFSDRDFRRIDWVIGVEYRTTGKQLKFIRDHIEKYILDSKDFANPPEASMQVRINEFNDSSIDILIYCFTNTNVWGEWLEIKENLALKIKEIVEAAGTSFAFPSRSIYMHTVKSKAKAVAPVKSRTLAKAKTHVLSSKKSAKKRRYDPRGGIDPSDLANGEDSK